MAWSDERADQLKTLWADGLSGAEIATIMGGGLTRNSVIGKAHRLGLEGRAETQTQRKSRTIAPRRSRAASNLLPPPPELPAVVLDNGAHLTVLTISDRACRWPIGDPQDAGFHFCGHAPKPGSPYCEAHARKAYQPEAPPRISAPYQPRHRIAS